jgi:serine/threonine protein kinase
MPAGLSVADLLSRYLDARRQNPAITPEQFTQDPQALQQLQSALADLSGSTQGTIDHPMGATPIQTLQNLPVQQVEPMPTKLGIYTITEKIGEGAMGSVYRGKDPKLNREVAIKVMKPELASNATARARFLREAQSMAAVTHDNIATIYAADEEANGTTWLAMEFLKGLTLDEYIKKGKPLKFGHIIRFGRDIARGLHAAHSKGLIHRDIKPANIWLEAPNGRVKLLDFGLARQADASDEVTGSNTVVGTPAYMSPEQANNDPALDHRSDLFSLGVVLYRLTTGDLPFKGTNLVSVFMALATKDPTPVLSIKPDCPTGLVELIHQLLHKQPEQRPRNAKAVAESLFNLEKSLSQSGQQPAIEPLPAEPSVTAVTPWDGIDESATEPAQTKLATSMPSEDGCVRFWDAKTHKHIRTIHSGFTSVDTLAWQKESTYLAISCAANGIGVVDTLTGKMVMKNETVGNVYSVAWSPDDKELVAFTDRVTFFDAANGKVKRQAIDRGRIHLNGHLTSDGRKVISKHDLWDSQREFDTPKTPTGWLAASAPDGRWYAYSNGEKELNIVHAKGESVRLPLPGPGGNWRVDATGNRIAGVFDKQVIVWDVKAGKQLLKLDHPAVVSSDWRSASVAWSRDGKRIATLASDKIVRLWDASDGKLIRTIDQFPQPPNGLYGLLYLAWNPDNRGLWFSLGSPLGTHAAQIDTETGRIGTLEPFSNGNAIVSLAVAPDGDSLLAREGYGWTFLRDRDGNRRFLGQALGNFPQWHPDARRFLGAEKDAFGTRAFDTRRNERLGTLFPGLTGDHWLCIGPDGHYRGSKGVESQIVYVAQLDDGSNVTYTPEEFTKQFNWKNEPTKARLMKLDP